MNTQQTHPASSLPSPLSVGNRAAEEVTTPANHRQIKVVANGCFDCLHAGHIVLLRFAKQQGDHLIVLVNSDESVKRLKGDSRPIMPLEHRVALLKACRYVDEVIVFAEDTPEQALAVIQPDVLVKGDDYRGHEIAGRDHAGRVEYAPLLQHVSTSRIVAAIVLSH
jgi:D-beta-D-heptose 7-phosphate kinase/D-beta-D-heptose 1-phosphate adenosyltransferase